MELKDKKIVVTGAGQGLGRAIAIALAAREAQLALVDLDAETLQQSAKLCRRAGGGASHHIVDVSSEAQVNALFAELAEQGPLHGLVNNAGILRDGLLVKIKDGAVEKRMSFADWRAVMAVNLDGVFLCGRAAATQMALDGTPGLILNISSISRVGNIGQSNYAAAKAGVAALTTTWGKELARFGIRSAAIAPGVIETKMVASMKEDARDRLIDSIPLKRLGSPDEIAHTAVYLFENDYVSGRVIEVDAALRL